ncbi:MAG: anti-sigma factor domain-containing protein [Lacipirellulaceae bacterium]
MPNERQDLMLLYVLDAVDQGERAQVERWLASGDPAAAAALAEARAAVAHLPLALPPVAPSEGMWRRLDERLKNDRAAGRDPIRREAGVEPRQSAAPRQQGGLGKSLAMAAMVAAIAAGATWLATREEATTRLAQIEELQAKVSEQDRRLQSQQKEIGGMIVRVERADRTLRLVGAPGLQTVEVSGTKDMPAAVGRLLWDADGRSLSFTAAKLAAPGEGKTYELWFVRDPGGPLSLGTFPLDADGRATVSVAVPEGVSDIAAIAVSIEPAGGAGGPAPTGPIVMLGPMR